MSIGINVNGQSDRSIRFVLEGILGILSADCDESTKQAALTALNRLVLQQITIRDTIITQPQPEAKVEPEAGDE